MRSANIVKGYKGALTTHGKRYTRAYLRWVLMRRRCEDPTNLVFRNYGGRGIRVCERWGKFENFYADMGEPPQGTSLDRIDNDGPYCPENCRWTTRAEQDMNKRTAKLVTFQGRTQLVTAWAREVHMSAGTLNSRLERGWPMEKAIAEPILIKHRRHQ